MGHEEIVDLVDIGEITRKEDGDFAIRIRYIPDRCPRKIRGKGRNGLSDIESESLD
ncbi:MAG: hypothetical protein ACD_78C00405G0001, partial [uncultured bacterium (gcode 4)]